ncbi:MAG TPA: antibiotic biosynthesis monooxygenase [Campylobacterales bacterium]|nr:antibiotic biosynthesis monooxygenase [Campylobacterales bacterium]HIP42251.1 antibiotic biosynthesis monooxygenase [Campylobacterales bacterium]
MSITKKVIFVAKENNIEELKALLTTMVEASRAEKGCLLYNIYQIEDKPTTFVVIETWESNSALNGHKQSAHYAHYKSNFEPYTADKYSDELISLG